MRLVISFWMANKLPISWSKRSAQRCVLVAASISCALTLTWLSERRTLPSSRLPHPKFAADLLSVYALAFVRERGIARDHENVLQARQLCGRVVGVSIGEILLLGVFAEICEGQNDDRQPRRWFCVDTGGWWGCRGKRLRCHGWRADARPGPPHRRSDHCDGKEQYLCHRSARAD